MYLSSRAAFPHSKSAWAISYSADRQPGTSQVPSISVDFRQFPPQIISQGLVKGCCSGLGFFIMKASGQGRLLLSSFGSIVRYDVAPGEVR